MKKNKLFTLIEMLVVIAIIAILASLLTPAIRKGLISARAISCANQLKGMQVASLSYADDNHSVLPGWGGVTGADWAVQIAEYTGANVDINTPEGRAVNSYRCPASEDEFSLPNQNPSWWANKFQITYGMSYLSSCATYGLAANSANYHYGKYQFLRYNKPAQPSKFRLYTDCLPGGTLSPSGTLYGYYYYFDRADLSQSASQNESRMRMVSWRHFSQSIYVGDDPQAKVNGSFIDGHVESSDYEQFYNTNTTPKNYVSLGYTAEGK